MERSSIGLICHMYGTNISQNYTIMSHYTVHGLESVLVVDRFQKYTYWSVPLASLSFQVQSMNWRDAIWHKSIGKVCMCRKIPVYGYLLVSTWKISVVSQSTEEACGDEQPCTDFALFIFIKHTSCRVGSVIHSKSGEHRMLQHTNSINSVFDRLVSNMNLGIN